jgi:hypothetical protein
MTLSSRRAKKQALLPQQSQPKTSESILGTTPNPLSLPSPRKVERERRRRRRRILTQMMISSMKRTIKLRRSYSLRVETMMISSGMMMAISHSLRKRKRRRRSLSPHSTQVSLLDPLIPPLLSEETKVYKRKGQEVVPSEANQWSVRKSKTLAASISR